MKTFILIAGFLLFGLAPSPLVHAETGRYNAARIVPGQNADKVEQRYAALLADRLAEMSNARIVAGDAPLVIHLGTAASYPGLADLADRWNVALPRPLDPGEEGFVLASRSDGERLLVLAIGADRRGVLYAVGELLRQAEGRGDELEFPIGLDLRHAPRWPVRGLNVIQGHTMRELTGAREWTLDEWKRAHIDYALAGANTFDIETNTKWRPIYDFVRDYGLRAHTIISGNAGSGPPEWRAKEAIGRNGYLSPVVPEAREALLEARENQFAGMPFYDSVHIKSGDGGGDESEAAAPYGRTFVRLCEDYARLLHKYHPETEVFVGNQKLDNAGDQAIFDYLRAEPRPWCAGVCFGPGSNAMGWMPGRRQDHRMDLFHYARRGAMSGYLRYMLHQLPPEQDILLFTDLTHWVYSQYGLMDHELIADRDYHTPPKWDYAMYENRPSEALAMVYNRRTFHARPRNYYRMFQETAEFTIGDVTYSEGHHDHLNQWMYQRLYWQPHQSVESVVEEYARTHFGPDVAATMAQAIFILEQNLQTPLADNDGIDRLLALLEEAGANMPKARMENNYLWRQYLQKACLDKYIQHDLRRQRNYAEGLVSRLRDGLRRDNVDAVLNTMQDLALPSPSRELESLGEKANRLGEESDRIFGVRSEGLFNLEKDYVGFGWLNREIERAQEAPTPGEQRDIVERIVHYDDPGEGGFYDNAGVPSESPRLTYGWPYGDGGFNNANRRSQRTMAFTTDEERGVTFRYTNLDPGAAYRVRLTLVRPRYLERFGKFQHQSKQSIMADETVLAENLVLPEYDAEFFEYDIPQQATADGELLLWMKKEPGIGEGQPSDVSIWRNTGGWGTLVSEVWLMKTDAP